MPLPACTLDQLEEGPADDGVRAQVKVERRHAVLKLLDLPTSPCAALGCSPALAPPPAHPPHRLERACAEDYERWSMSSETLRCTCSVIHATHHSIDLELKS